MPYDPTAVADQEESDPQSSADYEDLPEEGEGDLPPSDDAGSEEETGGEEGAAVPEEYGEEEESTGEEEAAEEANEEGADADIPASPRAQERFRELAAQVQRYRKFEPILEVLEEDPGIAREIIARRLLGQQAQQTQQQPQQQPQQQQPRITPEQLAQHLRERPVETLQWMINEAIRAQTAPAAQMLARSNVEVLIDSFKAKAAQQDPERWSQYEPYFDALVERTDPGVILSAPRETLNFLKRAAFGTWFEEAGRKLERAQTAARARRPARTEAVRPLTSPSGAGSGGQNLAKATRQLSPEERVLAERYGLDLVMPDEGEE